MNVLAQQVTECIKSNEGVAENNHVPEYHRGKRVKWKDFNLHECLPEL